MIDASKYQMIPRKRAASGALFVRDDMVLLVKPTYKDHWEIPGGITEALEAPHLTCLRECREELGIEVELDYMAVVDWMPEPVAGAHDSFQILFMGKPLTAEQEARISVPTDELSEWAYVPFADAMTRLTPNLAARVQLALDNRHVRAAVYAENSVRVL